MDIFSYQSKINIGSKASKKERALEWEEGAAVSDLAVAGAINKPKRLWLLPGVTFFAFVVLVSRLMWLQVHEGGTFSALANDNRIRERVVLAPRGLIEDAYGEELAGNTARFRLVLYPTDVPREAREDVAEKLAEPAGRSVGDVLAMITDKKRSALDPVVLLDNMPPEQRVRIAAQIVDLPGVSLEAVPTRDYKNAKIFSHVLGYTGTITQEQLPKLLKEGYSRQDFVGKSGVEATYEKYLKGVNGARKLEVDATGKVQADLGEVESQVGNTLQLEIDGGLQKRLYDSLSQRGELGAAVALDPRDGAVRALVSLPGFDTNELGRGLDVKEGEALFGDPKKPMFNRAISGVYPPGSTVKPMVAAAAINEGIVDDKTTIVDEGALFIQNRYNPSISYRFNGWKRDGLGPVNAYSAVARSSDIYFYVVGGGHPSYPKIEGLGVSRLAEYYQRFGLGKKLGIDIPGEATGLVPDPKWKENYYKDTDPVMAKWYLGDTYHISIGQGDMLATPLQAAMWTAVIANGGVGYKPRILKQVKDLSGRSIHSIEKSEIIGVDIRPEVMKIAQETMRETVLVGSAKPLLTLPITSAGKTGTSQFDGSDPSRTHAWFVAYAPYENPEIAIAVLVEAGGEGHAAAVPAAKEALDWWAKERYCKQQDAKCDLPKNTVTTKK